ncbi:hypothetical protein GO287_02860 [Ralstonia solanacearum]|nr:hypothetical protein GO278_001391 [Ralstonia solanacearum]NKA77080.1 hypothetical protein [Ralstonia solanacearum]NKG00949.1 hypothetical protein [Ralstonia solanacearum]NKG05576.1 hypothetical protein [Ralstonia solanacearum]
MLHFLLRRHGDVELQRELCLSAFGMEPTGDSNNA